MVLSSTPKVIFGSIAFGIFWVLAVFPAVPFLPIGRTAGSLLGAMLMVIFGVLTADQAYAAIDLPILGLLFGTMVVSVYLERADMFKYLGKLLSWKSQGPKDLLCRICLISAVSSAFFTNDTSCVILTEFVLKVARQHNLPPHPFLLALASSANIGSSATPIGNPQNLVIAIQSKLSFGEFLIGILPAMLVGIVVNASILLSMYWRVLSTHKDEKDVVVASKVVVVEEEVISHRFAPLKMSHLASSDTQEMNISLESISIQNLRNPESARNSNASKDGGINNDMPSQTKEGTSDSNTNIAVENVHRTSDTNLVMHSLEGKKDINILDTKWKVIGWKACVYIITIGMLAALLVGLNMSWTAITAALLLMVLDFKDARPSLEKVSYSLLVFFCGMFITVDGFNKTGIPSALWDMMEPYSQVDCAAGIAVLALVILVLSNLASNVPTGMFSWFCNSYNFTISFIFFLYKAYHTD